MDVGRYIRRELRLLVPPVIGLALASYFACNLVGGDRGLIAWNRLNHDVQAAEHRVVALKSERQAAEHRLAMLQPAHIDGDLLDEEARAALNLIGPREVVILDPWHAAPVN